jgi:hypothetical protein
MPGIIMILHVVNQTHFSKRRIIAEEGIIVTARKDGSPLR